MSDLMYSKSQDKYYRRNDMGDLIEVPKYAAEKSSLESALIATGETLTKGARNIGNFFGGDFMADPAEDQAMRELREINPVATTVGDMLPSLATAPISFGGGLVANLAGQAGLGALEGAVFGGDLQSAMTGSIGGIGGEIAGRVLGRAVNAYSGARQGVDHVTDAARQYMETGGVLTPAQRTGNNSLQNIEAALESGQLSGRHFANIATANQDNLNNLVIKALGIEGVEDLTGSGLAMADKALADQFSDLATQAGSIELTQDVLNQLNRLAPKADLIDDTALSQFLRQVGEVGEDGLKINPDSLVLPGNTIAEIRTELTSRIANSKSAAETKALGKLMDRLDDEIAQQAGEDVADAYHKLRKQYELLQTIKVGDTVRDGDVSMSQLRNRLKQHYGSSYEQRLSEISPEMGAMAQNVAAGTNRQMTPNFGRSGTAEHSGSLFNPMNYLEEMAAKSYLQSPGRFTGAVGGSQVPLSETMPLIDAYIRRATAGTGRAGGREVSDKD